MKYPKSSVRFLWPCCYARSRRNERWGQEWDMLPSEQRAFSPWLKAQSGQGNERSGQVSDKGVRRSTVSRSASGVTGSIRVAAEAPKNLKDPKISFQQRLLAVTVGGQGWKERTEGRKKCGKSRTTVLGNSWRSKSIWDLDSTSALRINVEP